jgi:SAM-dependent methyltransferase
MSSKQYFDDVAQQWDIMRKGLFMVDYAFANMYLYHVESPADAIKEMARILKPGGKLVITDLDEHKFEFLRTEQYDRWMGFKRSDVSRWFTEAGLKNVRVDCVSENCCAQSECGSEQASVSPFLRENRWPGNAEMINVLSVYRQHKG